MGTCRADFDEPGLWLRSVLVGRGGLIVAKLSFRLLWSHGGGHLQEGVGSAHQEGAEDQAVMGGAVVGDSMGLCKSCLEWKRRKLTRMIPSLG
jgi:hypothetical protein